MPAQTHPRCHALVPCAGVGQRAGIAGPKQYAQLAGRSVVARTLAALAEVPRLVHIMVVLSAADESFDAAVPADQRARLLVRHCGGATRAASVANGLAALREAGAAEHDWVLVHDAARCLLRAQWVERLIDECLPDAVGGLLALPVADTLKRGSQGRSNGTVDRNNLWAAQTPQMFRLAALQHALAAAGEAVTDEASAIEAQGLQPKLVRGDARNIKLTWPEDFALAESLLRCAPTPVASRQAPRGG